MELRAKLTDEKPTKRATSQSNAFFGCSLRPLENLLLGLVLLLCLGLGPVSAQTPSPTPTSTVFSVEELRRALEEVDRKLDAVPALTPEQVNFDPNEPPDTVESLRRYDVALRRLITLEERKDQLHSSIDEISNEIEAVGTRGLADQKPFNVELLDSLQNQLDLVSEKSNAANLADTAAKTSLEMESKQLKSYQALRRRILDSLASSPNDVDLRHRLEKTETAITTSEAGVQLAHSEIKVAELQLHLNDKTHELLQLKLEIVQSGFHFSKKTLDSQLSALDKTRILLTENLQAQRLTEEMSRQRLQTLRSDKIDDEKQSDELQARQEWLQTHQRKERLLEEQLEYNLIRRDLWERRYLAYNGQTATNYKEWLDSTRGLLVRLQNNIEVLDSELGQIRSEMSELAGDSELSSSKLNEWKDMRLQALINRQEVLEGTLLYLQETESLAERLLAELSFKESTVPMAERLSSAWSSMKSFWNIELYTLGDSSVTVGKFSVAVLVLFVGLALVGRVTRLLSSKFFSMLPLEAGVKTNLERLFRYFLTLLVFLFSLHVVNIPLTLFTFLGGTLAIAVGFGAQNILNNFISGLILMVERPVRAGDIIEIDGTTGIVEEIGARSTRVRVPTGIHVIIPNSSLLENKVVNWTLQDHKLRTSVSVGVAYGSPTRKVMELIAQAVSREEGILKMPAPVVTFDAFADNSLDFTVHFWVSVASGMDRDRITTAVRLSINDLFTEHGIVMPFPQRNLNFEQPLSVQVLRDEAQAQQGEPGTHCVEE